MFDRHFQDRLLGLLVRDKAFMRRHRSLIDANDFDLQDNSVASRVRYIVATIALEYYDTDQEPVAELVTSEVKHFCAVNKVNRAMRKELLTLAKALLKGPPPASKTIAQRLRTFKTEAVRSKILKEMVAHLETGGLTDDLWMKYAEEGMLNFNDNRQSVSFFDTVDSRNLRRNRPTAKEKPAFFIPPLDFEGITSIGRGQLGVIIAPTNRGKSLALVWLGIAHTLQRYSVLHITLEDHISDVEDRYDAAYSGIPIKELREKPRSVQTMISRYRTLGKGANLYIVDATDGGLTVREVHELLDSLKRKNFQPDVVIIDYDAEIQATNTKKEKHEQYDQIYQDLRQLAAKENCIVWTASQTKFGNDSQKIIEPEQAEGAMWKTRKASLVLSLGKAEEEWGRDSAYIWVAKNKNGRAKLGCYIVGDRSKSLIYDDELTRQKYKELGL